MALEQTGLLVNDVKEGLHGFVVADALRVGAAHDAVKFVRDDDGLLLYHLIITDDVEHYVWRSHRETADFLVGEELVGHLDDTLAAKFVALQIVADGNTALEFTQAQKVDDGEYQMGRNMVDDGAVFKCGNEKFIFHSYIAVLLNPFMYGWGDMSVCLDAQTIADECLTNIKTVFGLTEVIGLWTGIHVACNLADTR